MAVVFQYGDSGAASGAQQGAKAAQSVIGARTGASSGGLSRPMSTGKSLVSSFTDVRDVKQAAPPANSLVKGTVPTCPAGQRWSGFKCEAEKSQQAAGPVASGSGTSLPDPVKQQSQVPASCPKGMMPQVVSGVVKCAPVVGGAGKIIDKVVDKLVDAGSAVVDKGSAIVDSGSAIVDGSEVIEPEVLPAGPLPAADAGMPTNVKIALGVGGALVLGGLVWMLARR